MVGCQADSAVPCPPAKPMPVQAPFFCCCSKGCCISWGQCPLKRARISTAPWGTSGRVQVSMLPQRRGLPVQVPLLGQPSCWLGGDNGHQFSSGVFRWPEAFQAVPVSPQPPLVSSPAGPCPWLMSLVPLVSVLRGWETEGASPVAKRLARGALDSERLQGF